MRFNPAMEMQYAAYGLRVASSFELPGMPPTGDAVEELPWLGLRRQEPIELDATWSAIGESPLWRGRQGDGHDLVIDRGTNGNLLFTYGDQARFRLHSEMTQLDCAVGQSGLDWQRVLIGKVLPSISVMRGREALHASVVEFPAGVVAIMGPSGAGKTTLALELLLRGRALFADDQLTLGRTKDGIWGYPGTPHMNIAEQLPCGMDPQPLGSTIARLAGERWFTVSNTSRKPRHVAQLCLIERSPGLPLELQTLTANPLQLAPFMLGLSVDAERQRERFELYADLMASTTLVRLTSGPDHTPSQLADLIEQAVMRTPEMVAGGVE